MHTHIRTQAPIHIRDNTQAPTYTHTLPTCMCTQVIVLGGTDGKHIDTASVMDAEFPSHKTTKSLHPMHCHVLDIDTMAWSTVTAPQQHRPHRPHRVNRARPHRLNRTQPRRINKARRRRVNRARPHRLNRARLRMVNRARPHRLNRLCYLCMQGLSQVVAGSVACGCRLCHRWLQGLSPGGCRLCCMWLQVSCKNAQTGAEPSPRCYHSATLLGKNLFITGGQAGLHPLSSLHPLVHLPPCTGCTTLGRAGALENPRSSLHPSPRACTPLTWH